MINLHEKIFKPNIVLISSILKELTFAISGKTVVVYFKCEYLDSRRKPILNKSFFLELPRDATNLKQDGLAENFIKQFSESSPNDIFTEEKPREQTVNCIAFMLSLLEIFSRDTSICRSELQNTITMMPSPISGEQWQILFQKRGNDDYAPIPNMNKILLEGNFNDAFKYIASLGVNLVGVKLSN